MCLSQVLAQIQTITPPRMLPLFSDADKKYYLLHKITG